MSTKTESKWNSVSLTDSDIEELNSIANEYFGTDDVSVRTVIRRLIADSERGGE